MSAAVRLIVASLLVGAVSAACTGSGSSGSSSPAAATIAPSASSGAPTPAGSADALPSGACAPSGSACATASASSTLPGFACPLPPTTLPVPSNRLTDVVVTPKNGYDEVAFVFGAAGPGSGVPPQVAIASAVPPFVAGASGQPLAVDGQRFVSLTFHDMVVADEAGTPTYGGQTSIRPSTPGVQEVVQSEAFEGVVGWIVGARAPGCVRVQVDPASSRLLVDVQQP